MKFSLKVAVTACLVIGTISAIALIVTWTAGFYVQSGLQRDYSSEPGTCYVITYKILNRTCDRQNCYTINNMQQCSLMYYDCYDVKISENLYINATTNYNFTKNSYEFQSITEIKNYIQKLNNTDCWYNRTNPTSNIIFSKPDPIPSYIVGLVLACLTGSLLLTSLILFLVGDCDRCLWSIYKFNSQIIFFNFYQKRKWI